MKDPLEEFVKQNRQAFDDKEVPEGIWKNIERAMRFRQTNLWNSVGIWRAAAIIFMAVSGYLVFQKSESATHNTRSREVATNEFNDVEQFYTQQITEKVRLIGAFQRSEGLNGFTHDFEQLEAMYMVLKEEMKNSPSQKVKDALVLNLLVRVDLLNQQLHKLEKEYGKKDKDQGRSV